MTPDLLTGPRGRRLCLQLACEASDDVRLLLHDLAYNADVAAGAAVVRFGWNDDGSTFETRGQVETSATTAALADAIRAVGAFTPTADDLHAAMLRAVDSARYWQEPDGEDTIAADAAVCASLAAIAGAVAALPETAWWSRDRTADQWAVEFDPSGDGAPFDAAPDGAQKWRASTVAEEARARAERPSDVTANFSGTWWSHPWGCPHTTGALPTGVPAGIPFVEDGLGWTHAVAVPVRGAGRTFEIRTAHDWTDLCRRFPIEVTASRRHDWYRVTGRDGRWLLPDWTRVAQEWDAVHLTGLAYLTAATREIEVDAEYSSVIGGWGPDETYWLTGLVREVEGARVHWQAHAPEGPWDRAP